MPPKKEVPRTYNLRELAEELYNRRNNRTTIDSAEGDLKEILQLCVELVAKGHTVRVTGFATIEPVRVARRKVRNPQTGELFMSKAHKKAKFTPHKTFHQYVNGELKVTKKNPVRLKAAKSVPKKEDEA